MALSRFQREFRDLIECILIPGLAGVLPWTWAYALFRQLSRFDVLYVESVASSHAAARSVGLAATDANWQRHRRLVTMVDHADYYLARLRSDRWMTRHLTVEGRWPAGDEAALLCTFHWGAGMWGLRHAAQCGMRAHALVAALNPEHFRGRWIYYHYIRLRNRAVSHALGSRPLEVGTSLRPLLKALKAGEQGLAAVDVPADQVSASERIRFLGQYARVPRALLRVAVEQKIPVTVFLTGLRLADGARFLRIRQLGTCEDLSELLGKVFVLLEDAVREEPALWHFWPVADRFFER
ncbi:MAG: hypothetical protein IPO35_15695 [Uliginosibacterium sp.]|nr:hypothetical protein [Uliginosibacterium sp.]